MGLGDNVFAWRKKPVQLTELPALIYRDLVEAKEIGWGYYENKLPIEIEIYGITPEQIRQCIADVEKAIFTDDTWGGLAMYSEFNIDEMTIEQKENIFVATRIILTITFRTVYGNPYAVG